MLVADENLSVVVFSGLGSHLDALLLLLLDSLLLDNSVQVLLLLDAEVGERLSDIEVEQRGLEGLGLGAEVFEDAVEPRPNPAELLKSLLAVEKVLILTNDRADPLRCELPELRRDILELSLKEVEVDLPDARIFSEDDNAEEPFL